MVSVRAILTFATCKRLELRGDRVKTVQVKLLVGLPQLPYRILDERETIARDWADALAEARVLRLRVREDP